MANVTTLILPTWSFARREIQSKKISFPRTQRGWLNSRQNVIFVTRSGINNSNSTTSRNPAIELDPNSMPHQIAAPSSTPADSPSQHKSQGLIFGLGPTDSWDSSEIGSPVVKRYVGDNEERWFMWYRGSSGSENSDSIGLAVSSNGFHWARGAEHVKSCADSGMVMKCNKNWWAFDSEGIRPSKMVIMSSPIYSSVYWLYYTGFSSEEVEIPESSKGVLSGRKKDGRFQAEKIFKSLPGLACSQDGRHWARIEGDHYSGALLDVGSREEWDSLFIAGPHVVVHGDNDLRMYYYSFDVENRCFALGLARSRDGIRWVKLGKIMGKGRKGRFDELGVMNASVIRSQKDGKYLMVFEGVDGNGTRSIGLAISPDGLKNWERLQEDPILEPGKGEEWDNRGVKEPCLIQMEDKVDQWRLYYVGVGEEGRTGIGVAVSRGSSVRTFRRCSGVHF